MDVEFTSRYGPAGPPSWLRGCHARCEAMGWYPTQERCEESGVDPYRCTRGLGHDGPHETDFASVPDDGWFFVRCQSCNGTGRVSWLRTIARVPKWLVRGVRTCWEFRPSSGVHVPEWSWIRRAWIAFKVAFLCDLGVRP